MESNKSPVVPAKSIRAFTPVFAGYGPSTPQHCWGYSIPFAGMTLEDTRRNEAVPPADRPPAAPTCRARRSSNGEG
jgi:hypothetical protein